MEKGCKNHRETLYSSKGKIVYVVGKLCNIYRLRGNPIATINQIVCDRIPITWKKITWIYEGFLFIIRNKIKQISHCAYQGKWPLLAGMKLHPSSEFHQLIDFQSIDHIFYAKLFLHYTLAWKQSKLCLAQLPFRQMDQLCTLNTDVLREGTMSWNTIWTRITFDHAFIQLTRKYEYWMYFAEK